jgi:hypothetical protein
MDKQKKTQRGFEDGSDIAWCRLPSRLEYVFARHKAAVMATTSVRLAVARETLVSWHQADRPFYIKLDRDDEVYGFAVPIGVRCPAWWTAAIQDWTYAHEQGARSIGAAAFGITYDETGQAR